MIIKRAMIYAMGALAIVAVLCQIIIDPSTINVASVCIVLASSLGMLLYIGYSNSLTTHPLSAFAIFGFCMTTQWGALVTQTMAWTAMSSSLYDPLFTFSTLALYLAIAIGTHASYRYLSARKSNKEGFFRGLFGWLKVYETPRCGALWLIGWVGLASYVVYVNVALLASPVGKVGLAFNFLALAPFLIPFYRREIGESYCNWKVNRVTLVFHAGLLVLLGLVLNTRGVMFQGIATVGLLYAFAAMRSTAVLTSRTVVQIGALAVFFVVVIGPVSDLATSMAIARRLRHPGTPVIVVINKTIEVFQRPDIIAAYREEQAEAVVSREYDERYIENPLLARLVVTKFHDNAFRFARKITTEDSQQRLRDTSINFLWAVLPEPILDFFGVGVGKDELNFSMGDYLPYLSGAGFLGGHTVGSMLGHGIALFGVLFPFVFVFICVALFAYMDLLTIRRSGAAATIAAMGLLQFWNYFLSGISFVGLTEAFYFLARLFWQTAFIYSATYAGARMVMGVMDTLFIVIPKRKRLAPDAAPPEIRV